MADRYYSVSKGEQSVTQVTKGSVTSGEAVELRVADSLFGDRLAVLMGLKALIAYLETKTPAPLA